MSFAYISPADDFLFKKKFKKRIKLMDGGPADVFSVVLIRFAWCGGELWPWKPPTAGMSWSCDRCTKKWLDGFYFLFFFFVATFRWQVVVPEFPAFVLFLWFYFIEKFVIGGAVHLFSWLKWAESDDDNDCDRRIWPLGTRIWQQWPPSLKPSSGLVNKRNITQRGIRPFLLLRPSLPFKEKSQQAPPISLLFTVSSHRLSDF